MHVQAASWPLCPLHAQPQGAAHRLRHPCEVGPGGAGAGPGGPCLGACRLPALLPPLEVCHHLSPLLIMPGLPLLARRLGPRARRGNRVGLKISRDRCPERGRHAETKTMSSGCGLVLADPGYTASCCLHAKTGAGIEAPAGGQRQQPLGQRAGSHGDVTHLSSWSSAARASLSRSRS